MKEATKLFIVEDLKGIFENKRIIIFYTKEKEEIELYQSFDLNTIYFDLIDLQTFIREFYFYNEDIELLYSII